MIEKNPHRPLQGKKRYIAIATLASLVATGGLVGATVTAQSTIANNQITITKRLSDASVTATGDPIALSFQAGADIREALGASDSAFHKQSTVTLTNSGEKAATVKMNPVADLLLPHAPFDGVNTQLSLMVTASDNGASGTILQQVLAGMGEGSVPINYEITIPAGESRTYNVGFAWQRPHATDDTKFDVATDLSFDLEFGYKNNGDAGAVAATAESTIAGNSIVITEAPKSDAKVEVSGTPMSLSFTEGDEVGANTSTARQEYVLTNTGETDATVRLQSVDDLVIPTKPGLGSQDVAGVLRAYTGSALEPGMVNAVFSQKVAGANAAPGTSLPFTVPAGESVTISVDFSFAKGTTIFTDYNKTFDLKFDYINKQ
ncbi:MULTISPECIES: hypothetical protein [Microbacterium]|uniref:hypothetical protein n=1 Tax=Microbacterium TaxID=33882 RepID=UPI003010035E